MNMRKLWVFPALVLMIEPARAVTYVTYAAWPDPSNACSGYLHLYTTVPNTTFTLYEANAALTSINTAVPGYTAVFVANPNTPIAIYGPFCTKFFKVSSDHPMVWEIEDRIGADCDDRHTMVSAADTLTYRGQVFTTFLSDDASSFTNAYCGGPGTGPTGKAWP